MAGKSLQKIVLIGAGNVASHLGPALVGSGLTVVEVYNRTASAGQELAERLGAAFVADAGAVTRDADLYIMAVADSAIEQLAGTLRLYDRMVVHTSGTIGMDVLAGVSGNIGVFYPLQTFAPGRVTEFAGIPVCLESNTLIGEEQLLEVAQRLTGVVRFVNSEKRRLIHLSAVFACNFPNFMYAVAEEIMVSNGIPFELLQPLILRTAENAGDGEVFMHQTGPAYRGDTGVLSMHRELLSKHPEYLEIYNLISNNIINHKKTHGKL